MYGKYHLWEISYMGNITYGKYHVWEISCMATTFGNDLQRERPGADLSSIICGLLGTIYARGDISGQMLCFKTVCFQ